MRLDNVVISASAGAQSRVYFDYDGLTGAPDGVEQAVRTVLPVVPVRTG